MVESAAHIQFINEFDDDLTAFYARSDWKIGEDEERYRFGIAIRMLDLPAWAGDDANGQATDVNVMVVPVDITDEAYATLQRSCGDFPRDSIGAIMEACLSYGFSAHITRMAASAAVTEGPHPSLDSIMGTDDYDLIADWIKAHGDKVATAASMLIGFALDAPQNLMGESGWDWIMPYMDSEW
jgi:hypothetical protein